MLQLVQGQTNETMVVTLWESLTITSDIYYQFEFQHSVTKQLVNVVYSAAFDLSTYPERYNEFAINTSVTFGNTPAGEWHYKVYQQEGVSGPRGILLEQGKLFIQQTPAFSYTKPNDSTTYTIPAN